MFTTDDLYLAFRQAKTALFYERRGVGLQHLAAFETDLSTHLSHLRTELSTGSWFDHLPLGETFLVPKRVTSPDSEETVESAVTRIPVPIDRQNTLYTQVRHAPSPQMAIVEVLYLWQFGPILDSMLSRSVLGARLSTRFHRLSRTSRWLFRYWPDDYNKFRSEPLRHAKSLIQNKDNTAIIVSADFTSFYEQIAPDFVLDADFVTQVERHCASLDLPFPKADYRRATSSLLGYFRRVSKASFESCGIKNPRGIPIGSIVSRLIGNLVLREFDRKILASPSTICYRRYVDDFVIVSRHGEKALAEESVLTEIVPNTYYTKSGGIRVRAKDIGRPGTRLDLHPTKFHAHVLHGPLGIKFLDAVRTDFMRLVSGAQAFIDESFFGRNAHRSLLQLSKEGETVRVLREADRPKLSHLAMSSRLKTLARISRMVRQSDVHSVMSDSLNAVQWVLDDDPDWVEHLDWMYRLLGISIATSDWGSASKIHRSMRSVWGSKSALSKRVATIKHVRKRPLAGKAKSRALNAVVHYLKTRREQVVAANLPPGEESAFRESMARGLRSAKKTEWYVALDRHADALVRADLRAADREEDTRTASFSDQAVQQYVAQSPALIARLKRIKEFVKGYLDDDDPWRMSPDRLFLCTRPLSYFDIAHRVQTKSARVSTTMFANTVDFVNALRGTGYGRPVAACTELSGGTMLRTPLMWHEDPQSRVERVRVVVSNFCLDDAAWDNMLCPAINANGRPELPSHERFRETTKMLRLVDTEVAEGGSPTIAVLPELAIPNAWRRPIARHVIDRGYALVTGLEYQRVGRSRVRNPILVVVPGQLKKEAFVLQMVKNNPANEERLLLAKRGLRFARRGGGIGTSGVYFDGPYGRFGILICSEMLEAKRVARLVGAVELVVVPAWNRDTATFDSLIRGTGRTIHAYIALSNNGDISDCRIWGPEKPRWREDEARLITRGEHRVISADLPIGGLALFHQGQVSLRPSSGAEWQPLPPGWPDEAVMDTPRSTR